jgi:hypothetical protein
MLPTVIVTENLRKLGMCLIMTDVRVNLLMRYQ